MLESDYRTPRGLSGSLDSNAMRGAEPTVRGSKSLKMGLKSLIVQDMMAQAVEPCQDGNIAALRQYLRVLYS